MNNLIVAIVLFGSILGLAQTTTGGASANASVNLDQTLVAQTQAVALGEKSKDAGTLKRLLTDDFQQVGSEGRLHDKDEFLGDARDGKLKDYTLYDFRVLPVNENAAIVTYDAVIHMPEGDDGLAPRYQHFSDVWVKQGEQWRLRFQQCTARRPVD